jgi:hypothetical protein
MKSNVAMTGTLTLGSTGTALATIQKGTVSVTVAALDAATEEDIDVTISGAAAGDVICVNPLEAAMETGVAVLGSWVKSANTVTIRVGNTHTAAITGSTAAWKYVLIKS